MRGDSTGFRALNFTDDSLPYEETWIKGAELSVAKMPSGQIAPLLSEKISGVDLL
jgi:hypothetical protein